MEKPGDNTVHNRHLVHSHAHEEDLPGTVNLQVAEGDDSAYGQALYPVPAQDPNDPLQWPQWKKISILVVCSLYSFLSNSALLGPSVYLTLWAKDFNIAVPTAANLINYANLAYGLGSLLLVPMYHRFGRRPVLLVSLLVYAAALIGCSQANTYNTLMGLRVLQGFASSVCEAIPVQLVNDIFFLHERGQRLGIYTVCLCLGSTGPLYAGYMLAGGYSWRLFFYVEFAFAMALLIFAFFVVEESFYIRPKFEHVETPSNTSEKGIQAEQKEFVHADSVAIPNRRSFVSTLKPWSPVNHGSDFFVMMARSFTYYLVPPVLWVTTTYGIQIGLGALTFNYTFPIKITAPPYNWSETNSGLITIGTLLGYLLAIPFTTSSDRIAAYRTRRNNGIREAEMRLPAMLPAMIISPAGLILYGLAAQKDLAWIAYFFGVGMVQFSSYFYFSFTLAYAIDSYQVNTSEMLIAMNLGKQLISFGMGLHLLDWVLQDGYAVVISGIFTAVLVLNNFALLFFMWKGKSVRRWMQRSWLSKFHKKTVTSVETA